MDETDNIDEEFTYRMLYDCLSTRDLWISIYDYASYDSQLGTMSLSVYRVYNPVYVLDNKQLLEIDDRIHFVWETAPERLILRHYVGKSK